MTTQAVSVEKQLRRYVFPNILAMIGISCYVLADTYFISAAVGPDGLTALNLVLPLFGLIFAVGSMIGVGAATRYTLLRAGGAAEADRCFPNALFWDVIVGAGLVALGALVPAPLIRLLGADAEILPLGLPYIRIVLLLSPSFLLNYTCTSFIRNDGAPKLAMAATLLSNLFNIVFDWVFMFPMHLGMFGAGLATAVAPVVSLCICLPHFFRKDSGVRFRWVRPSLRLLLRSAQLGIAAFIGEFSGGVTTLVFNFVLLGLQGNAAVAAYGVIANVSIMGMAILNGVANGLQPMASAAHGSGRRADKRRILRHGLLLSFLFSAGLLALTLLFAPQIVTLFNSSGSESMAFYAEPGLRLYFIGFLFAGANTVLAAFLSATDAAGASSLVSVLRGIALIIAFTLLLPRLWGITGVWLAFPATEAATLPIALYLLKKAGI